MIVAGFGFRQATTVESLTDAFLLASEGIEVTQLATVSAKAEAPAFVALSQALGLPIAPVDAARLATVETETQSAYTLATHKTGSVAEAAALLTAGPGGRLVKTRVVSGDGMATCALARPGHRGGTK
ncbi:MAG: cobalamin biosynthesis protein [Pseudomonadota bacterium]